jgi:protein phosphatase 1L
MILFTDYFFEYSHLTRCQSVFFFGVFDGHSGRRACEYARDNLPRQVHSELSKSETEEALRRAFLKTDEDFLKIAHKEGLGDGSTAITALVRGRTLWVANAGDARAVLVSGSSAIAMSEDHKPNRESERRRITQAGGTVTFMGCWRVNGVLATSRGFGDRELKKVVSAEPEIRHRTLTEGDDYLVLASDGIWDVLSNQNVADIVARAGGCRAAASAVTEEALRRGSMDNVTAVVISLRSVWGGTELPSNQPPPPRAGDTPRSSLGSASFGDIPPPSSTSPLAGRRAAQEPADSWSSKPAIPLRASFDNLRLGVASANGSANGTSFSSHRADCAAKAVNLILDYFIVRAGLSVVGVGRSANNATRLSMEAPAFRHVHFGP